MNLFIFEESSAVRERMVRLLSGVPEVTIAGQAGDIREAMRLLDEAKPRVLVFGIGLTRVRIVDILSDVKRRYPSLIVVFLADDPNPQLKRACLNAGADYFLDKAGDFEQVVHLVRNLQMDK